MFGQYKNSELIKAGYLSGNPFTKELIYRWKLYIRAFEASLAFINGELSMEVFEKRIREMEEVNK